LFSAETLEIELACVEGAPCAGNALLIKRSQRPRSKSFYACRCRRLADQRGGALPLLVQEAMKLARSGRGVESKITKKVRRKRRNTRRSGEVYFIKRKRSKRDARLYNIRERERERERERGRDLEALERDPVFTAIANRRYGKEKKNRKKKKKRNHAQRKSVGGGLGEKKKNRDIDTQTRAHTHTHTHRERCIRTQRQLAVTFETPF